jgi:hypothetical protein
VRRALLDPVPRDHRQSDAAFRRRRVVAVATIGVGGALLGWSLRLRPGDPVFYLATTLLALCWTTGALASGPLHLGRIRSARPEGSAEPGRLGRPWLTPLCVGLLAVGVFAAGALVVAGVPALRAPVNDVLDHARFASLPVVAVITAVNGVAEELFFRGALYAALGVRYAVAGSTLVYTATTVASGNAMLVFAAAVLGLLVGLERRVTGGVLAPVVTHVTWSLGMLFVLPPLMG